MGNNNARNTMMLLAGGYLVYLGYTLIKDVLGADVENEMMFMAFGVLFIAAGLGVMIHRGKDLLGNQYTVQEEPEEPEKSEAIEEVEEVEEINEIESEDKES